MAGRRDELVHQALFGLPGVMARLVAPLRRLS